MVVVVEDVDEVVDELRGAVDVVERGCVVVEACCIVVVVVGCVVVVVDACVVVVVDGAAVVEVVELEVVVVEGSVVVVWAEAESAERPKPPTNTAIAPAPRVAFSARLFTGHTLPVTPRRPGAVRSDEPDTNTSCGPRWSADRVPLRPGDRFRRAGGLAGDRRDGNLPACRGP